MNHAFRPCAIILLLLSGLRGQIANNEKVEQISDFVHVPFYFEQNRGQANLEALYVGRGPHFNVVLTRSGATISHDNQVITMQLVAANRDVRLVAELPTEGVSNYYLGSHKITGVQHYTRVRGHQIFPGIDIIYYSSGTELEYDLVLHPAADPAAIRFHFEGVGRPEI